MLKMVGSFLIFISSIMLGIEKGMAVSFHRKELEELYRIFVTYQAEMKYLKPTIEELLLKVTNKVSESKQRWLLDLADVVKKRETESFENLWVTSINTHFKDSHLTLEERNVLKQLGKNMGCPEAISLYLSRLELSIQNTREEEKEKKKLYRSLGIMGGIFLVILLL